MQPMQMARAQVLKSFTLKFHTNQQMLMGEYERKNKGVETPWTPRSRSTRFPSLRRDMDWWKCRSRSPLTFPQRYARIIGGIKRGASFPRSTMVGERGENVLGSLGTSGEESPLNRCPKMWPLCSFSAKIRPSRTKSGISGFNPARNREFQVQVRRNPDLPDLIRQETDWYQNHHNFCIRTLFSMFLGSLKLQQREL